MNRRLGGGAVQSLLGVEVLAILFVLALIAAATLGAELLKRQVAVRNLPPEVQAQLSAELDRPLTPAEAQGGYPTIVFDDTDQYVFDLGTAILTKEFIQQLKTLGPTIRAQAEKYGANRIEVLGHTDESPFRGGSSTLDANLVPMLAGAPVADEMTVIDNVGLGMLRASVVVGVLAQLPELAGFQIVPLSAGQTILPDGSLSRGQPGDNPARRRIELRLLRLQPADTR